MLKVSDCLLSGSFSLVIARPHVLADRGTARPHPAQDPDPLAQDGRPVGARRPRPLMPPLPRPAHRDGPRYLPRLPEPSRVAIAHAPHYNPVIAQRLRSLHLDSQ